MLRRVAGLCLLLTLWAIRLGATSADDWPGWRGPEGDNHASSDVNIPLRWDINSGQNVVWKTKIPGRGHSTPVVVGDSIYLTTSELAAKTQSLIKIDRHTGRLVDQWILHRGTLPAQIHPNNSHASPTPVFADDHLYVAFHTDDSIWLTAITTAGRTVWKKRVCEFKPSAFKFGYGASPIIEEDVVIVAAEYDGKESGLYALQTSTGKQIWKVARPSNLNFASPIAATIAGQRQVLLAGADQVCGYDPHTGRKLWSVDASTEAVCGTIVWDGRHVLVSGGNPEAGTWCVSGDGTPELVWKNGVMCYEQSLLAIKNHVFAVADNGVAYCWQIRDGVENWRARLFSGRISASPLLVDNRLLIASQEGTVYVIAASPDRFDLLAENPSGDSIFASPVAVDDRLYLRTGVGRGDDRQEVLIAIGKD